MHDSCTCWKSMLAWIECLMAHSSAFAPLQPTARLCSLADLFRCSIQFLPWVPEFFFSCVAGCFGVGRRPMPIAARPWPKPETAQEAVNKTRFLERSRYFLFIHVSMSHRWDTSYKHVLPKKCGLFKNWIRTSQETFGTASCRQNLLFLHECSPLARDTPLDVWLCHLPSHALFWSHLV